MKVLVIGGAGYIGSHMVKRLGQLGCQVTTLDDLTSGHRDAVLTGDFVLGSIADVDLLDRLLGQGFDAVMHFASLIQVGESVQQPGKYYQNNVVNTPKLLASMRVHGIQKFIFSSTAATFGEPQYTPIDERHPQQPINPYGRTKLMVEQVLADYDAAYGLKSVCLRYFNAAGLTHKGSWASDTNPRRTKFLRFFKRHLDVALTSVCLGATTTRRMALALETTCTSPISAMHIGLRCNL